MAESTSVLIVTAITIALMHTLAGPDHYLPFIVLGRSEKWSLKKVLAWTTICGAGHVLSSILVGTLGIALGWTVSSIEWVEGFRGNIAVWALIVFGFLYMTWGIIRGIKGHSHGPHTEEAHSAKQNKTFWALFIIFVLGPCEPLIPMLMIPAAAHRISAIIIVATVFSAVTILTMVGCVLLAYLGFELFEFKLVKRYMHAFSGLAIGASGLLILAIGL